MSLNENQKIAVEHKDGPMLVLAGPGSGKTTIIIHRVKNLIENEGVDPNDILVITFTKAAADEMKERFLKLKPEAKDVSFGTFHSLFFRIIRPVYGLRLDNVLQEDEKKKILKKIAIEMEVGYDDEDEFLKDLNSDISRVKNEMLKPTEIIPNLRSDVFVNIFNAYEEVKRSMNKIDFDDMLVKCYEALTTDKELLHRWQMKYKYILIDEFQDINKIQHECILLLKGDRDNIFAVGDDDQSIYGFRGARPEFLLDFPKIYKNAKVISTDINYRSTDEIIKLSNAIIKQNTVRYDKNIIGTNRKGQKPIILKPEDITNEADVVAKKTKEFLAIYKPEEIAVIYRTNIQARAIMDTFKDYNISYQVKDYVASIYEHWIAKDIIAYLKLAIDKNDNKSLERIINKPARYISRLVMTKIKNECTEEGDSYLAALYSSPDLKSYQLQRIEDLKYHLGQILNKKPYDAVDYILNVCDYNSAIENYADYKKLAPKGLFEIANEFLEASKNHETIDEFLSYIEDVLSEKANTKKLRYTEKPHGVVLTTMHSAKGLQFEVVFVIGAVDGIIPHEKSVGEENIEEERRLFYVALTRAKNYLYVSIPKTRYNEVVKPTRFLHKFIKK